MANAHSHAFHRALRGRTQRGGGTFWTWREQMYAVAGALTPDTYFALARATYAEMALAGITCVGEFHYLHHDVGGTPLRDPTRWPRRCVAAAAEAGIRITLLDTCYLTGGVGQPLAARSCGSPTATPTPGPQRVVARSSPAAGPRRRRHPLRTGRAGRPARAGRRVGARARGAAARPPLRAGAPRTTPASRAYGLTPTELLDEHGALGPLTSAVHATHLTADDIALLGGSRTTVCMCPTTERDLADGIGPARALADRRVAAQRSAATATP